MASITPEENPAYFAYSDERLRRLIAKGDPQAFRELYARYWLKAFLEAKALLHDEGDARELAQTLFADLWRNPQDFKTDHEGSFAAFLAESIRNRCFSFLKHKNRSDLLSEFDDEVSAEREDEGLSQGEVIAEIRKILAREEATAVILRVFESYSFARIAYLLSLSEDAASSLYRRAIKKLEDDPSFIKMLTESVSSGVSIKGEEAKKK